MLKLALSTLCENPTNPTGLTTLYRELVGRARHLYPEIGWLVFVGPRQEWTVNDPRVEVIRDFPSNDRMWARLWADHFLVATCAVERGAQALITTGFVPIRAPLPVAMQVFTVHHLQPGHGGGTLRRWYRSRSVANGLRRARVVITNSDYAAGRLRAISPAAAEKFLISPEGLDHTRFNAQSTSRERGELTREFGLSCAPVLWVSNFYRYKQAELLIAAYARLPERLRERHPLLFVGGDWQGERTRAERAARALGLARYVRFLDWVEERWLPALYRHSAVHVLPSAEETFGRTVSEAMACGCPCLLNDIPALREVASGAAAIVDFRDEVAASYALNLILTNAGYSEHLKQSGLLRAAEFSFDRLVRERVSTILARLSESHDEPAI